MLPTISTSRLRLRPVTLADADDLYTVFSDLEVVRYWSRPPLAERAEAVRLAARMASQADEGPLLQWAIVGVGEDRLIGTCTLAEIDLDHRRAAISYALARSAWGQGLASEAVRALVGWGFEALDLHRIAADVHPQNGRSLRLLGSLGFVSEGLQRECYRVFGAWEDAAMLGLLRRDWRS